jgi:hypothetical protein
MVQCVCRIPAHQEEEYGREKGALLEKVFKRKLIIGWQSSR